MRGSQRADRARKRAKEDVGGQLHAAADDSRQHRDHGQMATDLWSQGQQMLVQDVAVEIGVPFTVAGRNWPAGPVFSLKLTKGF